MNGVETVRSAATLLDMLHIYGDALDTKWLERIFETVINFSVCFNS
jgi:hypothetical protein